MKGYVTYTVAALLSFFVVFAFVHPHVQHSEAEIIALRICPTVDPEQAIDGQPLHPTACYLATEAAR